MKVFAILLSITLTLAATAPARVALLGDEPSAAAATESRRTAAFILAEYELRRLGAAGE